jgi:hypothetical protein
MGDDLAKSPHMAFIASSVFKVRALSWHLLALLLTEVLHYTSTHSTHGVTCNDPSPPPTRSSPLHPGR